jgi:alkanesulfonate monooxygenase SsuD/methylene tetrahydromethanopterin reductase-like flavin-dependent oxidoreductase (luciferase family)
MDRLDEAVQIAKLMFTEERPSFEGKFYRIERALNVPRPIQKSGPKILIGGGGEKRTLRILAKHGDIGHWFGGPLEDLKRKRRMSSSTHCVEVGRNPSDAVYAGRRHRPGRERQAGEGDHGRVAGREAGDGTRGVVDR